MTSSGGQNFSSRVAQVVTAKGAVQTTGAQIMQVAELLRPYLMEKLCVPGIRDENGMPVQPARIRAIALIIAQELIKDKDAA